MLADIEEKLADGSIKHVFGYIRELIQDWIEFR